MAISAASIVVFTISHAFVWSLLPNQTGVVQSWSIWQLEWYSRLGDFFVCFSTFLTSISHFPLTNTFTDYIIQGHRFNIYEDLGCAPSIYFTWPTQHSDNEQGTRDADASRVLGVFSFITNTRDSKDGTDLNASRAIFLLSVLALTKWLQEQYPQRLTATTRMRSEG